MAFSWRFSIYITLSEAWGAISLYASMNHHAWLLICLLPMLADDTMSVQCKRVTPRKSFCLFHVGGFVFSVVGLHIRLTLKTCSLCFILCATLTESRGLKPNFSICHLLNHGLQWFSNAIVAKPIASFRLFIISSKSSLPKLCPFAFLKTQIQFITITPSPTMW